MKPNSSRRRAMNIVCAGVAGWLTALPAWTGTSSKGANKSSHWPAWKAFRQRFINDAGRVIDVGSERSQTFSEGQAYALFFALVANDRPAFEAVLHWTEDNLCRGDLTAHLPAWLWGRRDDGTWGILDSNSASDADLWIAYALAQGGRLWNERRYRALASVICERIVREETDQLPNLGTSLLPGPVGFVPGGDRWRLNPSYMPLQLMRWFSLSETDPVWRQLASSSLKIITAAAIKGFAPDWIIYDSQQGFLPDLSGLEKGRGGYNAIRVYLWAGMLHPNTPARSALLKTLAPMARYVREQGQPPESIDVIEARADQPGPSSFSAALLPFLAASAQTSTLRTQLARLTAKPPTDQYYSQALTLFGRGWFDGWYRFGADGSLKPRWATA